MLSASAQSPNMQRGENPSPAPKPENWRGVAEGLNRARQLVQDGQFQKAIDTLKEILEFAPSEPKVWRLLGDILGQHGHTQKAEACHEKADRFENNSQADTLSMPVSKRLASLLWSQGETEAARSMLALLLMRKPEDAELIALRDEWGHPENR